MKACVARLKKHVISRVVSSYCAGRTVDVTSRAGPEFATSLAIELAKSATTSSAAESRDADGIDGLKDIHLVDGLAGRFEVSVSSPSARDNSIVVVARVTRRVPKEKVSDLLREALDFARNNLGGRHATLACGVSRTCASALRFLRGSSPSEMIAAAFACESFGNRLIFFSRTRQRLSAHGLDAHDIALLYPQWFRCVKVAVPLLSSNGCPEQTVVSADALLPIVTIEDALLPLTDVLKRDSTELQYLNKIVVAFFNRRPVKSESVEGAADAWQRVRNVTANLLCDRSLKLTLPCSFAALHQVLHWHLVEPHFGSLLQAFDEAALCRFGDDLLLSLDSEYVSSVVAPLLQEYTRSCGTKAVPIVEFFEWTWSAVAVEARPDLFSYAGHFARYLLRFPNFFVVDIGSRTVSLAAV